MIHFLGSDMIWQNYILDMEQWVQVKQQMH